MIVSRWAGKAIHRFVHSTPRSMENTVLESIFAATLFLPGLHSISKSCVCAGKNIPYFLDLVLMVSIKGLYPFSANVSHNAGKNYFVPLFLLPELNVLSFGKEFDPPVRDPSFTAFFYMPSEALLNYASHQRESCLWKPKMSLSLVHQWPVSCVFTKSPPPLFFLRNSTN